MNIEMNDFECLTTRFAVYECFTELKHNFCEEELKSLREVYERLDPANFSHRQMAQSCALAATNLG